MRLSKDMTTHLRELRDSFLRETGRRRRKGTRFTRYEIAELVTWLEENGGLTLRPEALRGIWADWFGDALRTEEKTLPDGTKIRRNLCVRIQEVVDGKTVQRVLWADIDDADHDFRSTALRQMREGIGCDVKKYIAVIGYVNELRVQDDLLPLPVDLDFSDVVQPVERAEAGH